MNYLLTLSTVFNFALRKGTCSFVGLVIVSTSLIASDNARTKALPLSIDHVNICPMTSGSSTLRDMTVRIKEGRIIAITPAAENSKSEEFQHVDGGGRWLMPGLTDMHVHEENPRIFKLFLGSIPLNANLLDNDDLLLPYIANGVLQVFNPAAMSEEIGLRDDIEAGRVLGPHLELAAMVDGAHPIWPEGFSHVAATPVDGRQFVRDMKADGFHFVKTYSKLDLATFTAVVEEARAQGVRVVGHIPGRWQDATDKWLQPGFEMVTHAEEFAYQSPNLSDADSRIPQYVALAKSRGVALTATLTLNERIVEQIVDHGALEKRPELKYVNPVTRLFWQATNPYARIAPDKVPSQKQVVSFNAKLAHAFAEAGIIVFAGTDTVVPGMIAGFSLHDELECLSRAGLSPAQILTTDTRIAAEWLGVGADRGTVEVGKQADLLLLSADPMENVANTRQIVAVVRDGKYLSREKLDQMMADLAARYAEIHLPQLGSAAGSGSGGHLDLD